MHNCLFITRNRSHKVAVIQFPVAGMSLSHTLIGMCVCSPSAQADLFPSLRLCMFVYLFLIHCYIIIFSYQIFN